MTGWGAHGLDQIQWALGMDDTGPVEIWTEGGRFEEPVYTQPESRKRGEKICKVPMVFFRYANGINVKLDNGNPGGAIFIGEHGKIDLARKPRSFQSAGNRGGDHEERRQEREPHGKLARLHQDRQAA